MIKQAPVQISSKSGLKTAARYTTKNAWAKLARTRWPSNGVKLAMAEWGLTEGEAKGLFGAHISQATIDKIGDHPRGGMDTSIRVLEYRFRTTLRQFLESERRAAELRARKAAAEAEALRVIASRLPGDIYTGPRQVARHRRKA
jgi:hypothetical protein